MGSEMTDGDAGGARLAAKLEAAGWKTDDVIYRFKVEGCPDEVRRLRAGFGSARPSGSGSGLVRAPQPPHGLVWNELHPLTVSAGVGGRWGDADCSCLPPLAAPAAPARPRHRPRFTR